MRRLLVARKIMATLLQPVYDAEGTLLYQPGEQITEDHKLLKSLPPGTYRHVVVEVDDPPAKSEPKTAAKSEFKGTVR